MSDFNKTPTLLYSLENKSTNNSRLKNMRNCEMSHKIGKLVFNRFKKVIIRENLMLIQEKIVHIVFKDTNSIVTRDLRVK